MIHSSVSPPMRWTIASLVALTVCCSAFAQDQRRAPVSVVPVRQQPVQQLLQLSGTVTAARAARLSVATSGLVNGLTVDAGDRVEKGAVLLQMDDELARLQWQGAAAAEDQASRALQDARRRSEEARRLAPQQSIAETVVRDLEAEVAEDEAALQVAIAETGYRRGILERHLLRAPFAGVISARYTELGEWVTPGDAVLELVATEDLRIDFQVPEDYLGRIDDGASVRLALAGEREFRHPGQIAAAVPVTDPTARTFLLRIVTRDRVAEMRPGMSARAELKLETRRSGMVVPRDAVLRFADGRVVVWVAEPGADGPLAAERLVRTGIAFDGMVEVLDGLSVGEQVVVRGNESLRNGQRVRITPAVEG